MQVYDLIYGSQISQANIELISGMSLENDEGSRDSGEVNFMDAEIRNYNLAMLKNLITLSKSGANLSKNLPSFFSTVREIKSSDLEFLTKLVIQILHLI